MFEYEHIMCMYSFHVRICCVNVGTQEPGPEQCGDAFQRVGQGGGTDYQHI